jgi:hypothetical protein
MTEQELLEALSAKFHEIYQREAARQGDVRHPNAYADLKESTKEFDRVLARFIMQYCSMDAVLDMIEEEVREDGNQ